MPSPVDLHAANIDVFGAPGLLLGHMIERLLQACRSDASPVDVYFIGVEGAGLPVSVSPTA